MSAKDVVAIILAVGIMTLLNIPALRSLLYPDAVHTPPEALKEWSTVINVITGGLIGYIVGRQKNE